MSSDDADDERDSARMTPVVEWVNPKPLLFTVFVVMPSEEVCTVRELPSGISVLNLKARLELHAGVPSQIYQLVYPDGEEITDDQQLLVSENILDGYVLKMQLLDNWDSLYVAVTRNNIEHVYHSGGVHLKGNIVISADESERYDGVVRERGAVSLFMASFLGLQRMVRMLLSVGVDVNSSTQFARTSLHAAVSKDHVAVLDLLLNHGASLRHADNFGRTALDIAKTVTPSVCAKRLRLMQLNLRGMTTNGQTYAGKGPVQTSKTHFHQSHTETLDVNRLPGKSHTSDKVALTLEIGRTRSNMSHRSESSAVFKGTPEPTLHKNRKHISASASAIGAFKASSHLENKSTSSSRVSSVKLLNPKRVVKWKDVPNENAYWHVLEFPHKQNHDGVVDAVNIKPVAIIQQKKILKFSRGKAGTTCTDPTQPDGKLTMEQHDSTTKSKAVRFTEAKLRYYDRLSASPDDTRSMRRKINIARKQGKGDEKPKMSEAFKNWLAKKESEREKVEEIENNSSGNEHASDGEEDHKMKDFNKKVRKQNRNKTRCLTPGNRPIRDIVELGSTVVGDPSNPPASTNITAHREWKRSRVASGNLPLRNKQLTDFMEERKLLEEKRQKLLMSAISYDEWMDHAEERKFIIQKILQADMKEMRRLEEEKFVGRFRMNSFDEWKQKIRRRELDERKKREIRRKYEQELAFDRVRMGKMNSEKPFEDWVQKKREEREQEKEMMRLRKIQEQAEGAVPPDSQEAYEQWFWHKSQTEQKQTKSKVLKDRELLGAFALLRQMRTATVSS